MLANGKRWGLLTQQHKGSPVPPTPEKSREEETWGWLLYVLKSLAEIEHLPV